MFRLCPSGDPNGPLRPVRYEIARALMSMTRSKSKAGYIDARPHIRQLEEVLLQRTAGAGPYMWVNRAISRARRHVCSRRAYVFRNAPAAHSVGPLLLIRIMCSSPLGRTYKENGAHGQGWFGHACEPSAQLLRSRMMAEGDEGS
jgi:hypothetical protein